MLYDPNWKLPEAPVQIPAKVKKAKPKSKRKNWRTLMLNAANVLQKQGWIRGKLHQPGVGFCTVGALRRADLGRNDRVNKSTYDNKLSKSYQTAMAKLESHLGHGNSVVGWNDSRVADAKTVISTLRKVAGGK